MVSPSPFVTGLIIGVVQQMQDDEKRPAIMDLRVQYDCDNLEKDEVENVLGRIRDAAEYKVSLGLGPREVATLQSYLIDVATTWWLERAAQRRM